MTTVTKKQIAKYLLLPGIMPRLKDLAGSGFGYAAFFMAQIYAAARLLEPGHPYLSAANIGRFGLRHVIAAAGANLKWKRENLDQIAVFLIILLGLALLVGQCALLMVALFIQAAHAGSLPDNFLGYFETTQPRYDIAFMLMDHVFGIPDFFNSCVAEVGTPCSTKENAVDEGNFPFPFHEALRSMMQLYSVGLLVVAVFIFCYFIIAVAAETAESGTPFGKRFNHVWAPLRMVMALGLLVPIAQGLNSGQWILLYMARWGSSFATNGWILFTDIAINGNETMAGNKDQLIAIPNPPPTNALLEFFTTVATCKYSYETMTRNRQIAAGVGASPFVPEISAWLVNGDSMASGGALPFEGTPYQTAFDHFKSSDIHVKFAQKSDYFMENAAGVKPICGELKLMVIDNDEAAKSPGSKFIAECYYGMAQQMWADAKTAGPGVCTGGGGGGGGGTFGLGRIGSCVGVSYLPFLNDFTVPLPTAAELQAMSTTYTNQIQTIITTGMNMQKGTNAWVNDLKKYGWGGAGIWYNRIAQINGTLIGAAYNLPNVKLYPEYMEHTFKMRQQNDGENAAKDRFKPYLSDGQKVTFNHQDDWNIAFALYQAHKLWGDNYGGNKPTGNIVQDAINYIFGTEGLFNIRKNQDQNVHPLAQLVAIGRGIIDSVIRNLGAAAGTAGLGAIAAIFNLQGISSGLMAASAIFTKIAMIGLSIGFLLYYVLPFMPFLYFFFAVGGWIKGIFEAMVGVPLWALAHIRIDGNGLPGDAAMGGYYLILEVFLRPIMIIFGLLAAIIIFTAQAKLLNDVWDIVVQNVSGFDADKTGKTTTITYLRGVVDEFFFTVIYAIVVYMCGLSSFKLIDQVPNGIMRWMGASVDSFGDKQSDPGQNLARNVTIGAGAISGTAQEAISGAGAAASNLAKFAGITGRNK